jgi:hypothetical protein
VEETQDTIYQVLPSTSMGGELSDQELGSVAGGGWIDDDSECQQTQVFMCSAII